MINNRIPAYLLLLLTSIIWGVAGPVIKHTLNYFSPEVFLTYRFFLSALVALAYFTFYPTQLPKTTNQLTHMTLHSIFTVLFGLGLLFFGFELTTSLIGTLLAATGPIFSLLLGSLFLKEHITKQEILGLSLAIIGSLVTVFTADGPILIGLFGTAMLGNALILLSRLADGLGGVSIKKALQHGVDPSALTHFSFLVGFITFMAIFLVRSNPIDIVAIFSAPLEAHLGVIYMALVSGTLGYTLANTALKRVELGEASIFSYLTVIFGAPVAILWLHEPLTPQFVVGGTIIACGVVVAEWKRRKIHARQGSSGRKKSMLK